VGAVEASGAMAPAAPSRRGGAVALVALAVCAAAGSLLPSVRADPAQVAYRSDEPPHRPIQFPVSGGAGYSNDWHAPRSGGRLHMGNDLFAPKHTPLVAVADGRVSWLRISEEGILSGRMLTIRGDDGWSYRYIHLNNDNVGSDDGQAPANLTVAPGIRLGARVTRGQVVAFVGDSGNAEGTAPHVHFEVLGADGAQVNPFPSLQLSQGRSFGNLCRFDANPVARPSARSGRGYAILDRSGGVFTFGAALYLGSVPAMRMAGIAVGNAPVVGLEWTPTGRGYWVLDAAGGVFTFGDAAYFGSVPAMRVAGASIGAADVVALASTPTGRGYWVVDAAGGVFAFGDAAYFGSVPGLRARGVSVGPSAIVAMVPTTSGRGYWTLDAAGGVFAFGDAPYFGSLPGLQAARAVGSTPAAAGLAPRPEGDGYWIVDERGGVYAFGRARYFGSVPGVGLCDWADVVDVAPSASGEGYWMVGADGRTWAFGDARYLGGMDRVGVPAGTRASGLAVAA